MELWFVFFVLLVAGLGIFAMFGYVKSEADKLELKHMLEMEQVRRQIAEIEVERETAVQEANAAAEELTRQVEELTRQIASHEAEYTALVEENDKLKASLELRRQDGPARETPPATTLPGMPAGLEPTATAQAI